MEGQIYTVSEVNGFIKNVIDGIPQLSGIYIRGEFGVRLEDDMVVTDQGAELFTPQSASIEQPF